MDRPQSKTLVVALCAALLLSAPAPVVAINSSSSKTSASKPSTKKKSKKRASRRRGRARGQQAISSERVREIQEALIRENYLEGAPSGRWDQRTKAAMQRYQDDNGWQTKILPDSRALIKLGLGPSYAGLLNPESMPNGYGGSAEPAPSATTAPATATDSP